MQRIWVLCKHFGLSGPHTFFGERSLGYGDHCPGCGSEWSKSKIIAATLRKHSSGILGHLRSVDKKDGLKVIWLEP